MGLLSRVVRPRLQVTAHCDLPCGMYDLAQARIEAESVKVIQGKMAVNDDPEFRARAVFIKGQRSDLVETSCSTRPPRRLAAARTGPRPHTTRPRAGSC